MAQATPAQELQQPRRVLELPHGHGNPRNSEGSFAELASGRIIFIYTKFNGNSSADDGAATLVQRHSDDQGESWSQEDKLVVANEGQQNVMSVRLLRLKNKELCLFYLRKDSDYRCLPYMRISQDDAASWSEPIACTAPDAGYLVVNNDRVIQLRSGRLVMPISRMTTADGKKYLGKGDVLYCQLSDDNGRTWRKSAQELQIPGKDGGFHVVHEPGVVELEDGRVMMFIRSDTGCQMLSYSSDGGEHWSAAVRSTLSSPVSPASIKRLPGGGHRLLAVWNDHAGLHDVLGERRLPLSLATSADNGATWNRPVILEGCPDGHYCYTAMHFTKDGCVLLGYSAMNWLKDARITKVPLSWMEDESKKPASPVGGEFDGLKDGEFSELASATGSWRVVAGSQPARLMTYGRGRGIHLAGGPKEQSIEFTSNEPLSLRMMPIQAERFTSGGCFVLVMEAYDGTDWQLAAVMGDNPADTGKLVLLKPAIPDMRPQKLRIRCISAKGVILQLNATRPHITGFFND